MRKYAVVLLACFVLLSTFIQTTAQNATFHQNDQVVIKSGIPYVWLRNGPTSDCACVEYVITSPNRVLRILDSSPVSNGGQNWWHVSAVTRPIKEGWVEEKSLVLFKPVPTATFTPNGTQQAHQFHNSAVQIGEGIPFIWIRSSPSSTANVLQKLDFFRPKNSSQCLTIATIGPVVRWDGRQWWRELIPSVTSTITVKTGWVEENSLVDCAAQSSSTGFPNPETTLSPIASSAMTMTVPTSTNAAYEPFERGFMIWRQDNQTIYVLLNGGSFVPYLSDSYVNLPNPTDTAPAGRYTPINGFGKTWNGLSYFGSLVRDKIGWATATEQGYTAQVSGYNIESAAKPDSHIIISLPNGRTVDMGSAFGSWSYN
jgi:hypothetical protein